MHAYVEDANTYVDGYGLTSKIYSKKEKVKILQEGGDVIVSSFREANSLLNMAFPNARKSKGASPKSKPLSQKRKDFKLDKDRTPVYKKDYLKDSQGIVWGHSQVPVGHPHRVNPHINILTEEGKNHLLL